MNCDYTLRWCCKFGDILFGIHCIELVGHTVFRLLWQCWSEKKDRMDMCSLLGNVSCYRIWIPVVH